MLTPDTLPEVQRALADAGVDGWLLYDFRGLNPIAASLLRLEGMTSRRAFALVPTRGTPVALTHAIEQGPWRHWPEAWGKEIYSSWKSLEAFLAKHLAGKRVAMEYSAGDAVPYLDRVPAGVLEMVREAGATVVSSGELVSKFYATWNPEHIASHLRAAEVIAQAAKDAFTLAGERARGKEPITEHELMGWLQHRFKDAGLFTDHGPNVSVGANAANPHYEPLPEKPRIIRDGEIVLIDLWAREEGMPYADQTWMASLGKPSVEALEIWDAVRDARDAAITLVQEKAKAGVPVKGADVDDAARRVIEERGYGQYFTHRTGHSIDSRDIHGSGPHLDNLETRDDRMLVPGVGFSIEPGIYIPGKIGMRTEVNVYMTPGEAVVTPRDYQRELIVV
ncbi:MAG: M24 family metallopeptidase [bacterium]